MAEEEAEVEASEEEEEGAVVSEVRVKKSLNDRISRIVIICLPFQIFYLVFCLPAILYNTVVFFALV